MVAQPWARVKKWLWNLYYFTDYKNIHDIVEHWNKKCRSNWHGNTTRKVKSGRLVQMWAFPQPAFFFVLSTHAHRQTRAWELCFAWKVTSAWQWGSPRLFFQHLCIVETHSLNLDTWLGTRIYVFFSTLWKSIGVLDKIQPFKNILLQF